MAKRKKGHWTEVGLSADGSRRGASPKNLKGGLDDGSGSILDILLSEMQGKEATEAELAEMADLLTQEELEDFLRKGMDQRLKEPLSELRDAAVKEMGASPSSQVDWNEGWKNAPTEPASMGGGTKGVDPRKAKRRKKQRKNPSFTQEELEEMLGSLEEGTRPNRRESPEWMNLGDEAEDVVGKLNARDEAVESVSRAVRRKRQRGFLNRLGLRARSAGRSMSELEVGPLLKGAWRKMNTPKGMLATGALGLAMEFLPDIADGIRGSFNAGSKWGDGKSRADELIELQQRMDLEATRQASRQKRIRRLQQENVARIVQFAPDLAQGLLAGQEIPVDGVVIGGKPRTDLLEQVAKDMAENKFQAPSPTGGLF